MEWFNRALSESNEEQFGVFIMLSWSLWEARNDMMYKGVCRQASDVVYRATELLRDFKNYRLEKDIPTKGQQTINQWVAPDEGSFKVNFDAAIFNEIECIGVGVAIRDSGGEVLALLAKKIRKCTDVFVAECIALHEALLFAMGVGLRNIEVEGDSMLTVGAVNSCSTDHSIAGGIVESTKFLAQSFQCFKLHHVRRSGNTVAHSLAKHVKKIEDYEAWMEDTPSFLHELVISDACKNSGVNKLFPREY